jgi:hypothetical protein
MKLYEENHIKKGDKGKIKKKLVDKRVDTFIVSVLIIITGLILFIYINNIKCN